MKLEREIFHYIRKYNGIKNICNYVLYKDKTRLSYMNSVHGRKNCTRTTKTKLMMSLNSSHVTNIIYFPVDPYPAVPRVVSSSSSTSTRAGVLILSTIS